ncbi:hypothetical protein [Limnoglobus roseus]|uniref:hypothetical protein n=1 Tax=Limnoglobus roseus TaxID=2598579 RepID=UPI00143CC358|nr:hypothetical protein [Limnoglobus roseus]
MNKISVSAVVVVVVVSVTSSIAAITAVIIVVIFIRISSAAPARPSFISPVITFRPTILNEFRLVTRNLPVVNAETNQGD